MLLYPNGQNLSLVLTKPSTTPTLLIKIYRQVFLNLFQVVVTLKKFLNLKKARKKKVKRKKPQVLLLNLNQNQLLKSLLLKLSQLWKNQNKQQNLK